MLRKLSRGLVTATEGYIILLPQTPCIVLNVANILMKTLLNKREMLEKKHDTFYEN